jgi:hypothetical protein
MVKKTAVSLIVVYCAWCAINPTVFHAIDYVNLVIHEAGHWVFFMGGEFVSVFGGSFLQVFIPIVFAGYFFHEKDRAGFAATLAWTGESLSNVSNYISDGFKMNLPLLGGDGVIHDWNYILSLLGVVQHSEIIGQCVWVISLMIIACSLILLWLQPKNNTPVGMD